MSFAEDTFSNGSSTAPSSENRFTLAAVNPTMGKRQAALRMVAPMASGIGAAVLILGIPMHAGCSMKTKQNYWVYMACQLLWSCSCQGLFLVFFLSVQPATLQAIEFSTVSPNMLRPELGLECLGLLAGRLGRPLFLFSALEIFYK